MSTVVAGCLLKKDNKYLLVQESKKFCYGKWNLPAGKQDDGETILDTAIRETREECGIEAKPTALLHIGCVFREEQPVSLFIFTADTDNYKLEIDGEEILDAKWFSYEEIIENKDNLRSPEWIIDAIERERSGRTTPLDIFYIEK